MKLNELFESKCVEVNPKDVLFTQGSEEEHDSKLIEKLLKDIHDGKTLAAIEVTPITPKLKSEIKIEIQKVREKLKNSTSEHADSTQNELDKFEKMLISNKHYVVMDGHHRVIAARKARLKTIPANIDPGVTAKDIIPSDEMINLL